MSDIADVLNRLNELGRTDLAEVVHGLMGERDGLSKALSAAKTVIESKDKAYSLIQQRWDAMAAKASTVDSERECNERLTSEIDRLREELDAANVALENTVRLRDKYEAELDALRKQEPVGFTHPNSPGGAHFYKQQPRGTKLYAAPVPAQAAVPDGEPEWPEYHEHGMGCGVEDRGITDCYEACRYGFEEAREQCALAFDRWRAATPAPVAPKVPWVITVQSSEVYSPSGDKWKDMVAATPAPVAPTDRAAAVEQAAALSEKVSGVDTANTIRHSGVVLHDRCQCIHCMRLD